MLRLIESSRNNLDLVLDEDNIKLIACNGIDSIDKEIIFRKKNKEEIIYNFRFNINKEDIDSLELSENNITLNFSYDIWSLILKNFSIFLEKGLFETHEICEIYNKKGMVFYFNIYDDCSYKNFFD